MSRKDESVKPKPGPANEPVLFLKIRPGQQVRVVETYLYEGVRLKGHNQVRKSMESQKVETVKRVPEGVEDWVI